MLAAGAHRVVAPAAVAGGCCTRRWTSSTTWVPSLTTWKASSTERASFDCVLVPGKSSRVAISTSAPHSPIQVTSVRRSAPGPSPTAERGCDRARRGWVDHCRQVLWPRPTLGDGLGRDVVPHALIHAKEGDLSKRDGAASADWSSGHRFTTSCRAGATGSAPKLAHGAVR